MDKPEILFLLAYFLLVMFDIIIVSDARRLLLDFLIGRRNRKNAKKMHAEQTFKNRIHMGYIQPLLKKEAAKTFRKYHTLYLVIVYSLIPQYTVILLLHVLTPNIIWYVLGAFLIIRFLLSWFYRFELGPQDVSVYAKKKK